MSRSLPDPNPVVVAQAVVPLLGRSNRLGADKRVTNFAGGNTSSKLTLTDPVTGVPVRVLAVKGSGGDLGTLGESGLAYLVLDRVLALAALHAHGVHEDDLVGYYEHCRFGPGGAVPSIDTPLHAFVDVDHVDHLHPDAVIALATTDPADGPRLVAECYGDDVGWLAWQRPGFELGLALRAFRAQHPEARGAVMAGHGMICWAPTSDRCESTSLELIERAERFLVERGRAEPFGPVVVGHEPLSDDRRRAAAARLGPVIRGLASTDRRVVGHFSDPPVVLDFLSRASASRLAAAGTSCPDHFLRTKIKPMLTEPVAPAAAIADGGGAAGDDALDDMVARLREEHGRYRAEYAAYYDAYADDASPPMRGADPAIVLVPGVGMWSFGVDPASARVAGEFYVNAINVMRGAEAVSSYTPIDDAEKFRIEYWELEERKLRMRPPAPPLSGRVALVTGAGSGIGRATAERLARSGACVVVVDLDRARAEKVAAEIGVERACAVEADVSDEARVDAAFAAAAVRFGGVDIVVNNAGFATAAALVDTTVDDWDRLHDVLARGSFLVSRAAARMMISQGGGGDIVYVVSKNAIVAGPGNVAYSAAKADQAHQVRLLAAELGPHGIRVNGINPDGVVEGSGIFDGAWREQRAAAYGVAPDELGRFYASRTLLGAEVTPEHVAEAVLVLTSGSLARTTGLVIPVDGGVASAFLR
jgi:rhamnulose-1-phosphate aldolase/alcohol dehydrogenase